MNSYYDVYLYLCMCALRKILLRAYEIREINLKAIVIDLINYRISKTTLWSSFLLFLPLKTFPLFRSISYVQV